MGQFLGGDSAQNGIDLTNGDGSEDEVEPMELVLDEEDDENIALEIVGVDEEEEGNNDDAGWQDDAAVFASVAGASTSTATTTTASTSTSTSRRAGMVYGSAVDDDGFETVIQAGKDRTTAHASPPSPTRTRIPAGTVTSAQTHVDARSLSSDASSSEAGHQVSALCNHQPVCCVTCVERYR